MAAFLGLTMSALLAAVSPSAADAIDIAEVSQMDIAYQAAVKHNDAETMDAILHDNFALVRGDGRIVTRAEIINSARDRSITYELQDEEPGTQTVRVWGDTAVVTALLAIKGTRGDEKINRRLWFSDTYVRTPTGWRYAFAQVSLPLPVM